MFAFSPSRNIFSISVVLGFLAFVLAAGPAAVAQSVAGGGRPASSKTVRSAPTAAEAERFINLAESSLLDLWIKSTRASWVAENFITDDTEAISAEADQAVREATARFASEAKRYEKLELPPDIARKIKLLKLSEDIPAPHDPAAQAELAKITVSLDSDYATGKWCLISQRRPGWQPANRQQV